MINTPDFFVKKKSYSFQRRSVELALYESEASVSQSFKDAIQDGVKKFVIFDDFIYTGSQMNSHLGRVVRAFTEKKANYPDLQLFVIAPYASEKFKERFYKLENHEILKDQFKLLTTETVVPLITDTIEKPDIELLNNIYKESALSSSHYLAYTDWKVADIKSIPQFLHCGIKLKGGIFRFLRSDVPLYPPYKDRQAVEASYRVSDHPFTNNSKVEFE